MAETITSFRAKYPEYDSIDDATLATKLYEKHYAGRIDRADFDSKFLGTPSPSEGNILDRAGTGIANAGAAMIGAGAEGADAAGDAGGNWLERTGQKIAGAFQGDATLELPNITQAGLGNSMSVGAASMMGSDEEYMRAVLEQYPQYSEGQDENGNAVVLDEGGKPLAYVNQPGLDPEDAYRFFGKAAAFVPAGKIAAGAGRAASSLGRFGQRLAAGATLNAGTDVAMQEAVKAAGGKDEVDAGQAVTAGIIGGAGEALLAPAAGRFVKALRGRKPTPEQAERVARVALRESGGAGDMSREQLRTMGRRLIESGDEITPEAAAAEAFGLKLTRGQMMPDGTEAQRAAKFKQLSLEEELKSMPEQKGQRLRDLQAKNDDAINARIGEAQDRITGGNASENVMEAAERVKVGAQDANEALGRRVDEAYSQADSLDASLIGDSITGLHGRIQRRLAAGDIEVDELTPAGRKTLESLKRFSERAEEGAPPSTRFKLVERQRRIINQNFGKITGGNKTDKALITQIKKAYDEELDRAFRQGLYEGDDEILDVIKNARSLRAEQGAKFDRDSRAGKAVNELLEIKDSMSPERVIRRMIGTTGLSDDAASVAKQYRQAVGEGSDAWNSFREMALLTIAKSGTTTETKGPGTLVSALKRANAGRGSSLVREIFTEQERAGLRQFGRAIEATLDNAGTGNPSGSARMILRSLDHGKLSHVPQLSDMLHNVIQKYQSSRALSAPKRRVDPISTTAVLQSSQAETRNR
mgnify:CR=1 FL=1